jgi:transposase InsO family protein
MLGKMEGREEGEDLGKLSCADSVAQLSRAERRAKAVAAFKIVERSADVVIKHNKTASSKSVISTLAVASLRRPKGRLSRFPRKCAARICSAQNSNKMPREHILLSVTFGDTDVTTLYDTGAQSSVCKGWVFEAARKAGIKYQIMEKGCLESVTGTSLHVYMTVRMLTTILGKTVMSTWHISDAIAYDAVLGLDVITDNLDYVGGQVRWQAGGPAHIVAAMRSSPTLPVPSTQVPREWHFGQVRVRKRAVIAARQAMRMTIVVRDDMNNPVGPGDAFVDINGLAGLVTLDEHSSASIFLQNPADEPWEVERSTPIGVAWQASGLGDLPTAQMLDCTQKDRAALRVAAIRTRDMLDKDKHWQAIEKEVDAALQHITSPTRRTLAKRLLRKYAFVFSAHKFDIGRATDSEHTITLKTSEPVFTKQYPLPHQEAEFVKEHVRKWLDMGLVEPANSPYNSAIFCVAKKGENGWRLVLDFRRLNAASHVDRYSIRSVEECLLEVGRAGSALFSCLDMNCGFYQLGLGAKARPLTAFTVNGMGQYQFLVTPMGLQGAPSSFSRLMDKVLLDVPNCVTFIDDVLLHSKDFDDHLKYLDTALSRFAQAGLTLNMSKCLLFKEEVPYLGHTLSKAGVSPGRDKMAALRDAEPPRDISSLRSYLGLANYFRKFVANFAEKAAPLHALTRHCSQWARGPLPPAALQAFHTLQKDITTTPGLALPTSSGTFHLFVDASTGSFDEGTEGGLGACLLQDQDGTFRPVAFASRALTPSEKSHSAFLLEAKALVFAIQHFAFHLKGRRFYAYCDHKPVVAMSSVHTKTLTRLQEIKNEFDFEVRYTPGGQHNPADFLSRCHAHDHAPRPPRQVASAARISAITEQASAYPAWNWKDLQEQDDEIRSVRLAVEKKGPCPARFRPLFKNLAVQDGLVGYLLEPRPGFARDRRFLLLPPKNMYQQLLQDAHDDPTSGHGREFATMERLRLRFFWPKMRDDVVRHIQGCSACDAAQSRKEAHEPVRPMPVSRRPNQRVHCDLWGPHKNEKGESLYVAVVTDSFTKLCYLRVQTDKSAAETGTTLLEWCIHYGIPEEVITDNGKEFTAMAVRDLWDKLKVRHRTVSPYHPRANCAERFNRTMAAYLRRMIVADGVPSGAWPAYIPALMIAYNTAVQASTRTSPFECMYGYSPNTAYWPNMEDIVHPADPGDDRDAMVKLRCDREDIRNTARDMLHAQQANMHQQNARARDKLKKKTWRPADNERVWVQRHDVRIPNPTLSQQYEEGIVLYATGPSTYKVKRAHRKNKTLNIQQLRPRANAIPEADPNLEDDTEVDPLPAAIAAIYLSLGESAQALARLAASDYRRRGIRFSHSFAPTQGGQGRATPQPPAGIMEDFEANDAAIDGTDDFEDVQDEPYISSEEDSADFGDTSWEPNSPQAQQQQQQQPQEQARQGDTEQPLHYVDPRDLAWGPPMLATPPLHPARRPLPQPPTAPPRPPHRRMPARPPATVPAALPAAVPREVRNLKTPWTDNPPAVPSRLRSGKQ